MFGLSDVCQARRKIQTVSSARKDMVAITEAVNEAQIDSRY